MDKVFILFWVVVYTFLDIFGLSVIQHDKNNNIINEFGSILNASNITGVGYMSIRRCCRNERKSAGGFIWKYKNVTNT